MRFVSASLAPVWKLFVAPDIPADAPASVTAPIDSYALPSGEVLKPVEIRLEGERANINRMLGRLFPEGTCGLFVGVLEAEDDGFVVYGAGADWWWTCFVNGEKVFDRSRAFVNGNVRGTFQKTDWIFPIHVRKGANVVVFHLVSGMYWSIGTGVLPYRGEAEISIGEGGSNELQTAGLQLVGTTTANPLAYHVGEEMAFVFSLKDPRAVTSGRPLFLAWSRRGDDGATDSGATPISVARPVLLRTTLARPGFVHISARIATFPTSAETDSLLSFEGGAGADIATLAPSATCPDDFDAFWARQRALLDAVPLTPETHIWKGAFFPDGVKIPDSLSLLRVKIPCAGPNPVTGLLAVPKAPGKYPVRVVFDGYSKGPMLSHRLMTEGVVTFHVNAHGYELFQDQAYYDAFFAPFERRFGYALDPEENRDPETAYFRGMALRVMRAFDFVKTLPEWNGRDLIATGGSQGGLQAVWAGSLVPGLTRCETYITWCSNMAGAALDHRLPGWHPEYVRGLDYFDTVFHAARIPTSCFVDFERIGLGDYTCPPSGVTMVYNAVRGPKRAAYYQNSTHMYVPPEPGIFRRFAETGDASHRKPSVLLVGVNGYAAGYVAKMLEMRAEGRAVVAGVVDPTAARCPRIAALAEGGAPVVDSLADFFATGAAAPDLAVVATPITLHAEQSRDLLARGIPVLCEKPAAGCLADAEAMAEAEKASGRFLAIGYQWAFCDAVQTLKRDILSGRFGAPLRMRSLALWPRPLSYYGRNSWAGKLRDGAGREVNDSPVNNAMAHYLFNMLFVLGEAQGTAADAEVVEARLLRANAIETFDTVSMRLRAAGADLFFHVSHAIDEGVGPIFEYIFEKGVARYGQGRGAGHITATFADGSSADYGDPYDDQWRKLTDCVAHATNPALPPPSCTIGAALAHTRCIEALKTIPVEIVAPERTHFNAKPDGDRLLVVEGLRERLVAAYEGWKTLADA